MKPIFGAAKDFTPSPTVDHWVGWVLRYPRRPGEDLQRVGYRDQPGLLAVGEGDEFGAGVVVRVPAQLDEGVDVVVAGSSIGHGVTSFSLSASHSPLFVPWRTRLKSL